MSNSQMTNLSLSSKKIELRRQLRRKRRALSTAEQHKAALALVETLKPSLSASKTPRIAMYWAADGEISLQPLMDYCIDQGIAVYLPILHPFKPRLWFARYTPGCPLLPNHYGIPEPQTKDKISTWQLSMVLMPLVGFDDFGGRIGMGGGFYDRTFAAKHCWPHQPKLVGVAHECQKLEKVPVEPWDIALSGVVTDKYWYCEGNAILSD